MKIAVDCNAQLGEGPHWDERKKCLYWVDILAGEVHAYDPEQGSDTVIEVGQTVGAAIPDQKGTLLLACHHGFLRLDPKTGRTTPLCDPENDKPDNRFNDAKCDPRGRMLAGTMAFAATPGAGTLYALDPDVSCRSVIPNVTISNGTAWSLDGRTMYYIDTPTREVAAWDYDLDTGNIMNRRVALDLNDEPGNPDGMCIDAEGMLWIAMCEAGRILRCEPQAGVVLRELTVPVSTITSCCFGDSDLGTLYITTSKALLPEERIDAEPTAGALYETRPGVRGVAANRFAG